MISMQLAQLKLLLATVAIISVFAVATMYRFTHDHPAYTPITRKHALPIVDLRESNTAAAPRKQLPNATYTDAKAQRSSPLATATSAQQEPGIQHQITPRLAPPT
jgi:hypothetical protein